MYEIFLENSAERSLKRLPREITTRIIPRINSLRENPKPPGCRKITGSENDYRIRIGDYRVIYEVNEDNKKLFILAIGHRKDVYNK